MMPHSTMKASPFFLSQQNGTSVLTGHNKVVTFADRELSFYTYFMRTLHDDIYETIHSCKESEFLDPDCLLASAKSCAGRKLYTLAAVLLYRAIDLRVSDLSETLCLGQCVDASESELSRSDWFWQWHQARQALGLPVRQRVSGSHLGLMDKIILLQLRFHLPAPGGGMLLNIFQALNTRNNSWMAHGKKVVSQTEWGEMFSTGASYLASLFNSKNRLAITNPYVLSRIETIDLEQNILTVGGNDASSTC